MNRFVATVSRVCADLKGTKTPFALVGGLAREAVLLITDRGFNREKNLMGQFEKIWREKA